MPNINPQIFREYDIRGIVGRDVDADVFETIGKAYGTHVKDYGGKTVSMGRDCRISSAELAKAMARGINSIGVDVIDIGLVTTPMLYFSLYNLDVDGGVMITASHNPGEYNGIKMSVGKDSIFGSEIKKIGDIAKSGNFTLDNGALEQRDIRKDYIDFLMNNVSIKPGIRLATDYGNGMVGIIGPEVLTALGCDLTELYVEPDGTFPNHHPDPTVEENLAELIKTVKDKRLELGIGFDGDGDRIGVVDENGSIVWGDMLVLILARAIIKESPNTKIIGDVKCSNRLFNGVQEAGGKAIMWRTGHSLIKSKMKSEGAALAGEMSGHVFFADKYFGYDDALYASLRLLEIISKTGKKVSELLDGVTTAISTPEIRVDCPEDIKFRVVEEVTEKLKHYYEVIDIDGARVNFPDGWGLVRASNTQPALVLRFEAETNDRLSEIRSIIEGELSAAMGRL